MGARPQGRGVDDIFARIDEARRTILAQSRARSDTSRPVAGTYRSEKIQDGKTKFDEIKSRRRGLRQLAASLSVLVLLATLPSGVAWIYGRLQERELRPASTPGGSGTTGSSPVAIAAIPVGEPTAIEVPAEIVEAEEVLEEVPEAIPEPVRPAST
ncbi:MAG: hypothetical protein O7C63_07885, partial [Alphaproteobacteria bacterium]|nr:hypothetical protein [Alphaproteobacteria bacterium]